MKKTIYTSLCIFGTLIPLATFVPFALENGLNMGVFVRGMFATRVAAFLSADLILSSLALWVFILFEIRKHPIKYWWLSIIANLAIGLSLALPLFLLLRELAKEPEKMDSTSSDANKPESNKPLATWVAIGIAIGVGIGVGFDNIAAGIGIGIALGAAIGMTQSRISPKS